MKLQHTKYDHQPRLADQAWEAPNNWKASFLCEFGDNIAVGIYDNDSRHDSQILWNTQPVHTSNDETIGYPVAFGPYTIAAGECGNLIVENRGNIFRHIPLGWATTCIVYAGVPYVLDKQKGDTSLRARDCITGHTIFRMPGDDIAMDADIFNGLLWAAVTDSGRDYGLSCSNGNLIRLPGCQAVRAIWDTLLFSSQNKIMTLDGDKPICLGELPCEKVMRMVKIGDRLRIAGANPDSFWEIDRSGKVATIGVFNDFNRKVGGTCFRTHISEHVAIRCKNGNQAVAHWITGGAPK